MGNGAAVQERYSETINTDLPQMQVESQPAGRKVTSTDAPPSQNDATATFVEKQSQPEPVEVIAVPIITSPKTLTDPTPSAEAKHLAAEAENKKSKLEPSRSKDNKRDFQDDESNTDVDDIEPVEVLLQFIPYYGQGDPANDSIVRSTLSGLSVEDIDSKDEYGNTLLLLACQYRCEDLVRIMLNKGADPNAVNTSGACCLHFACYRESASFTVAKVLLQNGANPDVAESTFGCTPLHYCAGTGDIEFCKLLLSYGAQINAYDFYSYTCVDYAREAGMADVCSFLQTRLDKVVNQNQMRGNMSMKGGNSPDSKNNSSSNNVLAAANMDLSSWESHVDPDSGGKYYIHLKTGECLWENELKARISQYQIQQQMLQADVKQSLSPVQESKGEASGKMTMNEAWLITQATQSRLITFLSKHDPPRLVEIEELVDKYKGREQELLSDLCAKYKLNEGEEFSAFQAKLADIRMNAKMTPHSNSASSKNLKQTAVQQPQNTIVSDISLVDPLLLQDLNNETRKKFETQFEEESRLFKKKFDSQLEEEKLSFRHTIGEKEGVIAKLTSEIESVSRQKDSLETEMRGMQTKIERLQLSGGEAVSQVEGELNVLKAENKELKHQLSALQQEYSIAQEKLKSLEMTLANLTSGNEEMIMREKQASEERAAVQREREAKHASELQELENKCKNVELRLKTDFNQARSEWTRLEKEMKDEHDGMKRAKDKEIDGLRRDLTDKKAQFAQEISSANIQIEDYRKLSEEAMRRADEAEHYQRLIQEELAEAKVVQKYNAQLHKDLQREQLARKKLHNDMEDLKGKIRVYVRIRPFSNSERERGSTESVVKDGKMTVLIKGLGAPDAKKFYDFDQVFGGSEGNSQTDVFKDTKHLIMSVVDGYNVCIFAYGQTGAGKSFTMIGAADIGNCMTENGEFDELAGITPRSVSELFRLLNERTAQIDYVIEVQMFQLYRDGLDDLLKEKKPKGKKDEDDKKDPPLKITLAEHSSTGLVQVEGGESIPAKTPGEVMKIFAKGSSRRATASTQMNAESSRSHLICCLVVKLTNKRSGNQTVGKLTLVDLAGSERVDKSGAAGEVLKEAQSINKSLSALGDVIAALTTGQQHIPYRNHPLTMLMSDSIGGNAKTLMFVNTSPADYNNAESNSSLAFASRCKDITNQVAAAPGVQAAQVSALKKELAKLKKNGPAAGGKMPAGGATLARPDTAVQGGRGPGKDSK